MAAKKNGKKLMIVGTAKMVPGERTRGELVLGHYPDSPIVAPVNIVCGEKKGPTLWIQGCIHGGEVGGPVSMLRFLDSLDLKTMKGSIVAVMIANPTAFRANGRNTPFDGENMNRVFPGSAKGPHTQQAANTLLTTTKRVADAMLDLHSGGDRTTVPFYAIFRKENTPTSRAAEKLARAAGTPDIWASTDDWLRGAMFTRLTGDGIPALIVECGGGSTVTESDLKNFLAAMQGVSQALGILPGAPPTRKKYRIVDQGLLVYSKKGGLFRPSVKPGAVVKKNQILGRLMDLYGGVAEVVRSPAGPGWISSIRRSYMPVYSGDQIAEVIRIQN